jgi:hypothetical protein
MCNAVENNRNQNKTREVYESIRKITGKPSPKVNSIKDKNGNWLSHTEEIKTRWKEYFEELYNDPNESDELMIEHLHSNRDEETPPEIMIEEVEKAINKLKARKAPGLDYITAEEIQAATQGSGREIVHKFCNHIWKEEIFPDEWKRAIITPIYKKKGKTDCGNYRGVSLLCHFNKVFTSILMDRIKERTEEILGEEQAGFRPSRSTHNRSDFHSEADSNEILRFRQDSVYVLY